MGWKNISHNFIFREIKEQVFIGDIQSVNQHPSKCLN